MIIVKLQGGLGNQMFQYACGQALALRYDVPLGLDHSFLEREPPAGVTPRDYALNAFGINLRLGPEKLPPLLPASRRRWIKFLQAVSGKEYHTVFEEDDTRVDCSFFEYGERQYLVGYFQNECYFAAVQEELRKMFTFVPIRSAANARLAQAIKYSENPVSIHVRRGDYLTIANGNHHGVLSLEYYAKAIDTIKSYVRHPSFFVFSADDPMWAREAFTAFGLSDSVVGDENIGAYGYEGMRMMSLCKHHIIANSSFSWWGAWLDNNPDKIVLCPARWYVAPRLAHVNPTPASWIRI